MLGPHRGARRGSSTRPSPTRSSSRSRRRPGTLRAGSCARAARRGIPVRTLPTVFELLQSGAGDGRAPGARRPGRGHPRARAGAAWSSTASARTSNGEIVMVTGAGGSIGSELCRQIARVAPRRLILIDHAEDNLFRIQRELEDDRHVHPSVARRRARGLQGGRADAGGVRRAPPDRRLPRRRLQARRAHGAQPGRGRPQQRARDAADGARRRARRASRASCWSRRTRPCSPRR